MIRIFVFDQQRANGRKKGEWTEIPNGPFPLTADQLHEVRRLYRAEWDACVDPLSGVKMSPQTTARALLRQVVPGLSDFDASMVGFAVSNTKVRIEGES